MATSVNIEIATITDEGREEEREWVLILKIRNENINYQYIVNKPYLHSKKEWLDFAKYWRPCIRFRGKGSIHNTKNALKLIDYPSGDEDISVEILIPRTMIAEKLTMAIEEADTRGLKFQPVTHRCKDNEDEWVIHWCLDSDKGWRPGAT